MWFKNNDDGYPYSQTSESVTKIANINRRLGQPHAYLLLPDGTAIGGHRVTTIAIDRLYCLARVIVVLLGYFLLVEM